MADLVAFLRQNFSGNRLTVLRNLVLSLIGLVGIGALLRLAFFRSYNYDEVSHAHMAWLVSVGDVPYEDFAANHFPFFWFSISPLIHILPETSSAMVILRVTAVLFNLLFLVFLGILFSRDQKPEERIWTVACLGVVAFSPGCLHFLVEFRPDSLANALLFGVLAWVVVRKPRSRTAAYLAGLGIGAAVLINTKFILFPFCLGLTWMLWNFRQVRSEWPWIVTILAGCLSAVGIGLLLLVAKNVPLREAWQMVVGYNIAAEKARNLGLGLMDSLLQIPLILSYIVAGLVFTIGNLALERRRPSALFAATLVFLLLMLWTTTRPWKQYAASWLLLAAYFPAQGFAKLLIRLPAMGQLFIALGFAVLVAIGLANTGATDPDDKGADRATQHLVMDWINERVPQDEFVVTSFHLHPVFRRDSFFKTVMDGAPNVGDGLERIMPALVNGAYGERFGMFGYQKDLERRPPFLIVGVTGYTDAQIAAIYHLLESRPGFYRKTEIPGTTFSVWEKSDEGSVKRGNE